MKSLRRYWSILVEVLQIGANFSAVCGLLAACYAFVYPGTVADYGATVLDLMEKSRADFSAIRDNTSKTAKHTGETANNTAKLAAAIPNWLTFGGAFIFGDGKLTPHDLAFYFENESVSRIKFSAQIFIDGKTLVDQDAIILPNESVKISASAFIDGTRVGPFSEVTICLRGTTAESPLVTIYERRIFRSNSPGYEIGNMVQGDVEIEPIAGCV